MFIERNFQLELVTFCFSFFPQILLLLLFLIFIPIYVISFPCIFLASDPPISLFDVPFRPRPSSVTHNAVPSLQNLLISYLFYRLKLSILTFCWAWSGQIAPPVWDIIFSGQMRVGGRIKPSWLCNTVLSKTECLLCSFIFKKGSGQC